MTELEFALLKLQMFDVIWVPHHSSGGNSVSAILDSMGFF